MATNGTWDAVEMRDLDVTMAAIAFIDQMYDK